MSHRFRCPTCEERLSCTEEMIGAHIVCPLCSSDVEVPGEPKQLLLEPPKVRTGVPPPAPQHAAAGNEELVGRPLPITFGEEQRRERDELDMTPMVDVTFLLLIFFMITAAFSLQKSFELPAPDDTQPSTQAVSLADLEEDPTYVLVRIDDFNTFFLSGAAWEAEQEAPSRHELLDKLRYARGGAGGIVPTHMLVMASERAVVDRVVMALDAGSAVGMEDVKMVTTPSEN